MQTATVSTEKVRDMIAQLWCRQYEFCGPFSATDMPDAGQRLDLCIERLSAAGVDTECDHVQAVRLDAVKAARNLKGRF